MRHNIATFCLFLALLFACFLPQPSAAQQSGAAPAAVPVTTVPAAMQDVSQTLDVVGRIEATERVELRARVTGFLEQVLFTDGTEVKEGDVLYRIEKGEFEAAVNQAQGALAQDQAALKLAQVQLDRAQQLADRDAGTVARRDEAQASADEAAGRITSDEAALAKAKINLGYTEITAPISGRIGRTAVTKGNVVGPDSGVLTTIVSEDPIYVTFPISQRVLRAYRMAGGDPKGAGDIAVQLGFSDGTTYAQTGTIDFLDVSVSRSTDTVLARAVMPNPDGALRDGELVTVNLSEKTPEEKIVIPQSALLSDKDGIYVFTVTDGKATQARLKLGPQHGTGVVVESGLSEGDQVITEGLERVQPGAPVSAAPAGKS
ncbi:efflux RND transporter periplasmic adaptor subunit [Oceanicella sp. SM1341]|uniref:efflux RND transporter periplasmic adaptor subunit n=1 Tax=Oceanicella sp. SM1341 TaxID=1548889 RepID=UPI000E52F51A|nr:efflux RND transporter periplasmic adaptor subunit [Oceanicella sp. SM1341]